MNMSFDHVTNICAALIGLLTIAYFYVRWQFSFWARKGVHFKKPRFPYGNFGDIVRKKVLIGPGLIDIYNSFKSERFGGVWYLLTPKLFVVDPNLVGEILVKDFGTWSHRGIATNLDVNPLEEHLLNLDGEKWKTLRSKLAPVFSSLKLKNMYYLLSECGENFEKYLDTAVTNGEPVEVSEMTAKFTTDVIGSCVFGIQMNSLNDENAVFRKMGKKIIESMSENHIVLVVQNGFPWLFKFLKLSTMTREINDFFIKLTKEILDYRRKNNIQKHDFMELLTNLKCSGESLGEDVLDFNDTFLAAQAYIFFTAGFHTSSVTISCCLHELAVNRDVQERLREELRRTKAAHNGEFSWDSLKNMRYLNMVVQETLRKYPSAPVFQRMSVRPYRIPGTNVDVPSGIKAIIPAYALHHDPQYYPDPEKFDPERFTEEANSKRAAFTYLPFGGGPRICIGIRFAEQQVKMALVKFVNTFKVSLCEKSQNPLRMDLSGPTIRPEIGVWLKISRDVPDEKLSP